MTEKNAPLTAGGSTQDNAPRPKTTGPKTKGPGTAGMEKLGFDTRAIHAGLDELAGQALTSCTVPIYQTAAYPFPDTATASDVFNHRRHGNFYTRVTNPTVTALERRLCALEGGVEAVCTASGMSAMLVAVLAMMQQGAHIVASEALYAGNYNLLGNLLGRFGVETTFVNPRNPQAFADAIRPETRLVFSEIICNPGLEVVDLEKLAAVAHDAGLPLLVDSTFATPYLCNPFDYGVDLVTHSVTKWLGGHGAALGGAIIDSGRYDWAATDKFPNLSTPCDMHDGTIFTERFGPRALPMFIRAEAMRLVGAAMAPMNAFQVIQGVETLGLRMQRHCSNALAVAQFLEERAGKGRGVEWVKYPGLATSPDAALVKKQLPKGAGGIVTFAIDGTNEDACRFIEALGVFTHASNVGDVRSLAILPAGTTQSEMGADALETVSIGPNWVRLSVGLEDPDDLIADLAQALDSIS